MTCNSCKKPNVNKPICDDCNFHTKEEEKSNVYKDK